MTNTPIWGKLWQLFGRTLLLVAGVVFLLYGLDGLVTGNMLLPAGRGGNYATSPSGVPIRTVGWEARLFGGMFVLLGFWLIDGICFKLGITRWVLRKLRVKNL